MQQHPIKTDWIFTNNEGIRIAEGTTTINQRVDHEKLHPISDEIDEKFDWLKNQPEYKIGFAYEFENHLKILTEEAAQKVLTIPTSFITFISNPTLLRKIRSTNDSYFELGEFIEEFPDTNGRYLLHFLSDSQYSKFWYLCLNKNGGHCVVSSANLYGHSDDYNQFRGITKEIANYEAPSFLEFIYRFWMENEIWFTTVFEKKPLNEIQLKYTTLSRKKKRK